MNPPAATAGGPPELVVDAGPRQVWRRRARRAGRAGLTRLRDYLRSPQGRRVAARTLSAVTVAAAALGGVVLIRGWLRGAAGRLAGAAAGVRAWGEAVRTGARTVRSALSLRWLGTLGRWLSRNATLRRYGPCPDCHARVRWDAAVCYGCGYRPGGDRTLGDVARRRGAAHATLRWLGRILVLSLYRTCPDCRRAVHADAAVCRHCGYRLRSSDPGTLQRPAQDAAVSRKSA